MLISIITAVLGFDESLEKTADSLPTDDPNFEWVIKTSFNHIDKKFSRLIDRGNVKIVATSDNSLYQALNQALNVAKGRYFIVLGAGDRLREDAVPALVAGVQQGIVHSASLFFSVFIESSGLPFLARPQLLYTGMTTPHPGAILVLDNVLAIGGFDERYKIASDYDLLCRYTKTFPKVIVSEKLIVDFKGGGLSERCSDEAKLEEVLVRHRLFGR
jgi:hypothetical protein